MRTTLEQTLKRGPETITSAKVPTTHGRIALNTRTPFILGLSLMLTASCVADDGTRADDETTRPTGDESTSADDATTQPTGGESTSADEEAADGGTTTHASNASSEDSGSDDSSSEDPSSEDPEDPSPEDPSPEDPSSEDPSSEDATDPYCAHAWNGFKQLDVFIEETNAIQNDPDMSKATLNTHGEAAHASAELAGQHFGRAQEFVVETETSEAFDALLRYQEKYMVPQTELAAAASSA